MRRVYARYALWAILAVTAQASGADLSGTLRQAQQAIDRSNFSAAIDMLERVLPDARSDNDQMLLLLRRAYRGEIQRLVMGSDHRLAQKYLDRLRLIEKVPDSDESELRIASGEVRKAESPESEPAGSTAQPGSDGVQDSGQVVDRGVWRTAKSKAAQATTRTPVKEGDSAEPASSSSGPSPSAPRPLPSSDAPSAKLLSVRPVSKSLKATTSDEQARNLIGQADALFLAGDYAQARPLYAQAHRLTPQVLRGVQDRWAYCRMVNVVNEINRPPVTPGEWSAIQAEVREILELIPSNAYALSLLRIAEQQGDRTDPETPSGQAIVRANGPDRLDENATTLLSGLASRIGLSHTDESTRRSLWQRFRSGAWQVLETSNFRIHYVSADENLAGTVADVAESTRIELYRTWFGQTPESNWQPKCDVFIHGSAEAYGRATGQGPASPGHSATGIDHGRILSRRVDLRRDGPDLIHAILPHEITHVVMADRFANRPLPRWADEGVAVLTEPPEKKLAHLKNLSSPQGRLYSSKQLMTMNDYPPGNMWGMFYAESVSLVQFLVDRAGPTQFIEFMSRSLQSGYENELKRSFGLASFDELDKAWSQGRVDQLAAASRR